MTKQKFKRIAINNEIIAIKIENFAILLYALIDITPLNHLTL